jgi:hypothetical protein
MRGKFALFAFIAVSVVLAASAAHAATPTSPGKPTLTLNYLEIQTNFAATAKFTQNQPPKLGDRIWFHSELYNWNGSKRGAHVGHADVTVVILTPSIGQVSAVGYLPGGTIDVLGQSRNQRVDTFAVVGGTGRYATARGELIVRSLGGPNSNKSANTIRLWL